MRSAVVILAVVSAAVAEAPYHLPRPGPHAPSFVYPAGPAPHPPAPAPPAPFPQLPQPRPPPQSFVSFPQPAPGPAQSFNPNQGYNYQPPSFGSAFIQSAPQQAPQPIPVHLPQPPVFLPAPAPHPHPIPAPLPISYPQPINYPQPQPQPHYQQPQPLPISYPQSHPVAPPQPIAPPQTSYGIPQAQPQPLPHYIFNGPQAPVAPIAPIAPLPAPVAPQPQPQFPSHQAIIAHYHQQLASQGYSYPQPFSQPAQFAPLPLQSQPLTNNAVSSYQADSNQYSSSQAQTHNEALDETVVSRVQNIIKENEHSSARNAGYLSLVSGVSLENAKPSVEISSFVHSSPQNDAGLIDIRSSGNSAAASTSAVASPASSYDVPTLSTGSSQSSESSGSFGFLPQNKPAISYGAPN